MMKILGLLLLSMAICHADIFTVNERLGKGVNLGLWLEAPDRDWGVTIDSQDIARIANRGFNTVRIPIRWETRTAASFPYTIDPHFLLLVDSVLDWAAACHLNVVINMHNHEELMADPTGQKSRFLSMWKQIASHFQGRSDSVLFEILNEPNNNMTADLWNLLSAEALDTIRITNPARPIVIGGPDWNGIQGLSQLELPNDPNIIVTFHYYLPTAFTHQGATFLDPVPPLGVAWDGSYLDRLRIQGDVDYVRSWSNAHNVPIWVGEFGSISYADEASRVRYANACARFFEKAGFSWSVWDYTGGFPILDTATDDWIAPLVDTLLGSDMRVTTLSPQDTIGWSNLVVNGDFRQGSAFWNFSASGASATGVVTNETYQITVMDPGTTAWSILLTQNLPTLSANTDYALVFDAWADDFRPLYCAVQNNVNWSVLTSALVDLSTSSNTFVLRFTVTSDDSHAFVEFGAGVQSAGVHIDNVRLINVSELPPTQVQAAEARVDYRLRQLPDGLVLLDVPAAQTLELRFRSLQGRTLMRGDYPLSAGSNVVSLPPHTAPIVLDVGNKASYVLP